jgi:hypothetical protein
MGTFSEAAPLRRPVTRAILANPTAREQLHHGMYLASLFEPCECDLQVEAAVDALKRKTSALEAVLVPFVVGATIALGAYLLAGFS